MIRPLVYFMHFIFNFSFKIRLFSNSLMFQYRELRFRVLVATYMAGHFFLSFLKQNLKNAGIFVFRLQPHNNLAKFTARRKETYIQEVPTHIVLFDFKIQHLAVSFKKFRSFCVILVRTYIQQYCNLNKGFGSICPADSSCRKNSNAIFGRDYHTRALQVDR